LKFEWHVIRDPADPLLDQLAERYRLHPLHIEDCRHRNQVAKVEENEGYLFAVLKPVRILTDGSVELSDLDLFLGHDFLITVEESHSPQVRQALDQLAPASNLRADQLFYRIVDAVVDSYLPILDHFDDVIDGLEDEVLESPSPRSLARIFETRRNLAQLRRVLANTRDLAGHLQRSQSGLVNRDLFPFLRDVYDHVARNLDTVEMLRDLLTGALDVYLSSVANRTNQVVKVLTVLGTVALPILVVSSIYGMNLQGLPWAESPHAVGVIAVVMAASTAGLLALLKFLRWL
jgi:magnesium transporter